MKTSRSPIIHVGVILGVVLLAAAAYLYADKKINFYEVQLEARHDELQQLRVLTEQSASQRAAYEWFQSRSRVAPRVGDLVKNTLPDAYTDLVQRELAPVDDRWSVYRYDLRIDRVSADALASFLLSCERAEPRIRVNELQVSALDAEGAGVSAQLSLAEMVAAK